MNRVVRILLIILSIAIGGLFLYSAYTKLNPIQSFEYTMVQFVHFPWWLAAIAARFFIGLEAALGALMVLHLYGKGKWVLKTAFTLLIVFSIYLVYLWIVFGNNVNCGCFGDSIWMSPKTSLIKNALLLIATGLLIRFHNGFSGKWTKIVAPVLLIVGCILPFILYAIPSNQPNWLKTKDYHIDLSALYAPGKKDVPAINLEKGKYIIAFFSPYCPHCQMAAYKMHLMKQQDTTLPFFMVVGGTHDISEFWKKTQATNIPYTRLERDPFFSLAGTSLPAIYFVKDGWVVAKADYITLDQATIEKWLKQP